MSQSQPFSKIRFKVGNMKNGYYRLVHSLTGYTYGMFESYDSAECARNMMDDWMMWSVELFKE